MASKGISSKAKINLPEATPDPVLVRLMGLEYAEDAARRDRQIRARELFENAEGNYREAMQQMDDLRNSHTAWSGSKSDVFAQMSKLTQRISRYAAILSEIHAEYGEEVRYW